MRVIFVAVTKSNHEIGRFVKRKAAVEAAREYNRNLKGAFATVKEKVV